METSATALKVHSLGYHAARKTHLPLDSGVYLARPGYVFESLGCDWGSLITTVSWLSEAPADGAVRVLGAKKETLLPVSSAKPFAFFFQKKT